MERDVFCTELMASGFFTWRIRICKNGLAVLLAATSTPSRMQALRTGVFEAKNSGRSSVPTQIPDSVDECCSDKTAHEDCSDKKSLLSLALLRGITIIETRSKLTQIV